MIHSFYPVKLFFLLFILPFPTKQCLIYFGIAHSLTLGKIWVILQQLVCKDHKLLYEYIVFE